MFIIGAAGHSPDRAAAGAHPASGLPAGAVSPAFPAGWLSLDQDLARERERVQSRLDDPGRAPHVGGHRVVQLCRRLAAV